MKLNYLIKDEELELKYEKGKGAWTYHIQIPNTKHIVGKWGSIKVSGFIDDYKIESINLFSITGQDKFMAVNKTIRNFIKKDAGDFVLVSLYFVIKQSEISEISEQDIYETLKDASVLDQFNGLENNKKNKIISMLVSEKSAERQTKILLQLIEQLGILK